MPNRATRTHTAQVYAFVAGDGKPFVIHLSSPEKFWRGLTRVAGHAEWLEDPRSIRAGAAKELRCLARPAERNLRHRERAHWLRRLTEEDVPSGPICDFAEVFADPQVEMLGMRVLCRIRSLARSIWLGTRAAIGDAGSDRPAVAGTRRAQWRDTRGVDGKRDDEVDVRYRR